MKQSTEIPESIIDSFSAVCASFTVVFFYEILCSNVHFFFLGRFILTMEEQPQRDRKKQKTASYQTPYPLSSDASENMRTTTQVDVQVRPERLLAYMCFTYWLDPKYMSNNSNLSSGQLQSAHGALLSATPCASYKWGCGSSLLGCHLTSTQELNVSSCFWSPGKIILLKWCSRSFLKLCLIFLTFNKSAQKKQFHLCVLLLPSNLQNKVEGMIALQRKVKKEKQ